MKKEASNNIKPDSIEPQFVSTNTWKFNNDLGEAKAIIEQINKTLLQAYALKMSVLLQWISTHNQQA
ncbi:MAG: hypothetical protein ACOYN4_15965 [Bacteroidales bacterium]